jgi:hypothetical protein
MHSGWCTQRGAVWCRSCSPAPRRRSIEEGRGALAARQNDADAVVRGEALVGLARRKDVRARPALILERLRGGDEQLVTKPAEELGAAFERVESRPQLSLPLPLAALSASVFWLLQRRRYHLGIGHGAN